MFLPSPEEKNRSTPPSLVEERKGGKHSRDQVNFHFIRRERSIIRFSLSLFPFSLGIISREEGREREEGSFSLGAKKEEKTRGEAAPGGIYICTSVWQLNYLCQVIEKRERERDGGSGIVFSPRYIPLLCRKEQGIEGREGNGVVVVTRFRPA